MKASKKPDENLIDNGGRRKGFDRRFFNYSAHIPERRSNEDRRYGSERRAKRRAVENDPKRSEFKSNQNGHCTG